MRRTVETRRTPDSRRRSFWGAARRISSISGAPRPRAMKYTTVAVRDHVSITAAVSHSDEKAMNANRAMLASRDCAAHAAENTRSPWIRGLKLLRAKVRCCSARELEEK